MAIDQAIKSQLESTLSQANEASRASGNADFQTSIDQSTYASAASKVESLKGQLNLKENQLGALDAKIADPAKNYSTETNSGGKCAHSTKQVDEEAFTEAKTKREALAGQIAQAKEQVGLAQQEAKSATDKLLTSANISGEMQGKMQELLTLADSLKAQVDKKETPSKESLTKLINGFADIKKTLPEDTKGSITKVFFEPLKKDINAILKA